MKKEQRILNNQGSVVTAMIIAGLVLFMVSGGFFYIQNVMKAQKQAEVRKQINNFEGSVRLIINDQTSCGYSLGGATSANDILEDADIVFKQPNMGGALWFQKDSKIDQFEIKYVKLRNLLPPVAGKILADIVIGYRGLDGVGKKDSQIPIVVTDNAGKIGNCHGKESPDEYCTQANGTMVTDASGISCIITKLKPGPCPANQIFVGFDNTGNIVCSAEAYQKLVGSQ